MEHDISRTVGSSNKYEIDIPQEEEGACALGLDALYLGGFFCDATGPLHDLALCAIPTTTPRETAKFKTVSLKINRN